MVFYPVGNAYFLDLNLYICILTCFKNVLLQ
jgi:hypothetical protein